MSARRGTANTTSERALNVEALAKMATSKLELIDRENFLEYFDSIVGELSRHAVHANEPMLAYLTYMASLEAKNLRNQIRAQWGKSAA